jgi:hypothetical protein
VVEKETCFLSPIEFFSVPRIGLWVIARAALAAMRDDAYGQSGIANDLVASGVASFDRCTAAAAGTAASTLRQDNYQRRTFRKAIV